jgi:hypothetical protein
VPTQASAVSQLAPLYPAAQVQVQAGAYPLAVPPLTQKRLPLLPLSPLDSVATHELPRHPEKELGVPDTADASAA